MRCRSFTQSVTRQKTLYMLRLEARGRAARQWRRQRADFAIATRQFPASLVAPRMRPAMMLSAIDAEKCQYYIEAPRY